MTSLTSHLALTTRNLPSTIASQDARKKAALSHFEEYLSRPIDDKPFVADATSKERDRLWLNWTQLVPLVPLCLIAIMSMPNRLRSLHIIFYRFCDDLKIDSRNAWLKFVTHPETTEGQAPFRAFLRTYVDTSIQRRSILGHDEYKLERMVKSAFSLTEVWRRLVASGEHHIMRHQRKESPSQAETWRLRWISKDEGSREGPAYRIVKVNLS